MKEKLKIMSKLLLNRKITVGLSFVLLVSSFRSRVAEDNYSLQVSVKDLWNSEVQVFFELYNNQDALPYKNFEKCFKKALENISDGTSTAVFKNLATRDYTVSLFLDENNDEKIKMGLLLPKEGVGFSNVKSIKLTDKPTFKRASFKVKGDTSILFMSGSSISIKTTAIDNF